MGREGDRGVWFGSKTWWVGQHCSFSRRGSQHPQTLTVAPRARQHTASSSSLCLLPRPPVLDTHLKALLTFPSWAHSSSHSFPLDCTPGSAPPSPGHIVLSTPPPTAPSYLLRTYAF